MDHPYVLFGCVQAVCVCLFGEKMLKVFQKLVSNNVANPRSKILMTEETAGELFQLTQHMSIY